MIAPAGSIKPGQPAAPPMPASQVVVFRIGAEFYALPVAQVREVLRLQPITPLPKAPPFVEGVISLRGRVTAVVDLRTCLDTPRAARTPRSRILIVRLSNTFVGLIVDGVDEVLGLPRESIQPAPPVFASGPCARFLSGVARLGTKLILLLDLTGLFSEEQSRQLEQSAWQPF